MSQPVVQKKLSPQLMEKLRRVPEGEIELFLRKTHPELFKTEERETDKSKFSKRHSFPVRKPKRDIHETLREIRDQDFGTTFD